LRRNYLHNRAQRRCTAMDITDSNHA
jgi:hypothetical protein